MKFFDWFFFHFSTVMVLFLFLFGACHLYHSLLRSSLVLFSLASSFLVRSSLVTWFLPFLASPGKSYH